MEYLSDKLYYEFPYHPARDYNYTYEFRKVLESSIKWSIQRYNMIWKIRGQFEVRWSDLGYIDLYNNSDISVMRIIPLLDDYYYCHKPNSLLVSDFMKNHYLVDGRDGLIEFIGWVNSTIK